MTRTYDLILAGGGLAGLSLAYHLAHSPLRNSSILIVDPSPKDRNDRTWCFWSNRATPFDGIVERSWRQFQIVGEHFARVIDLGEYRYRLIRGIDFYEFVRQELDACGNVEFLQGTVDEAQDARDGVRIEVDGETYTGRWLFDSRFKLSTFHPDPTRYHTLRQYFKGWMVETHTDAFNPAAPYFMDMRTPQKNELRFFYVLPFSERRALVEFVTLTPDRYEVALKGYLEGALGLDDYALTPMEGGVNPLTDYPFPRRAGRRIMNIGVRGGRIKASTGYAFLRIQRDSAAIVASLLRDGHPFGVPPDSRRYRLCDSLMLDVIQRHGDRIKPLFTALFKNNPIDRVLRFLDETASPAENVRLMASLPPGLFLQSMLRMNGWRGSASSSSRAEGLGGTRRDFN
ncbi:MAG: lycopene cyclase family protein [Anaerolineae bacterium]